MANLLKRLLLLLLVPSVALSHPGIGIVQDSKGNIYYTDLHQVWKIAGGKKAIIIPDVHTHELYIDKDDNLYGEGGEYIEKQNKFYHYLWVYRPNGKMDTVLGMKEAYIQQDFSLSRDKAGNEYYVKLFIANPDTTHIFKKSPDGRESIFATGNFKGVKWLHPLDDQSLLYSSENAIYRADASGNISLVKDSIGNTKPSFKFSENSITLWGIWVDKVQNIYVAVFSDQAVKKIDKNGNLSEYYKSSGNWTPLHGVFDNENKLWVLEGSDKNDVRVVMAGEGAIANSKPGNSYLIPSLIGVSLVIGILIVYFRNKDRRFRNTGMLIN